MKPCDHGWNPPVGMDCPDCLWEMSVTGVTKPSDDRGSRLREARQATLNAICLMPDEKSREKVLRAARNENRWKAIKVARQIRHTHLAKEQAK